MKLIDDIKKAEEKAEKMKKEAEIEGQNLLEKEQDNATKAFAQLEEHKDKLTEEKLAQAREEADKDIKVLDQKHQAEIKNLKKSFNDKKNSAITKVQEIILKWPSSQ